MATEKHRKTLCFWSSGYCEIFKTSRKKPSMSMQTVWQHLTRVSLFCIPPSVAFFSAWLKLKDWGEKIIMLRSCLGTCGRHVLNGRRNIIQSKWILVLGMSKTARNINQHCKLFYICILLGWSFSAYMCQLYI